VEGVTITLGPQIRLRGRVRAPADAVLSTVSVMLEPRGGGAARMSRPDASGSFALAGLEPDTYAVNATGLPEGTWLSGFRLGTQDLPGGDVDLSQDPGVPLEVVLSDGAATVGGLVLDEAEKPVVGASVALLPAAERFRERRLMRFGATDQHGRYSLSGVPPGEYTVVAWDGVDPDLLQDHDFLRGQLERGKRVSVAARDRQTVQIKAAAP
jgi:hypothetical protein